MYKVIVITQKILFPIVIGVFLSSCNSKKENFDIDISNFKPNKTIKKTSESKNISVDNFMHHHDFFLGFDFQSSDKHKLQDDYFLYLKISTSFARLKY